MIAHNIIVSFHILSLLKYDIWSMTLMGENKVLDPAAKWILVQVPDLAPEIYVLFFMTHLISYYTIHIWNWNLMFLG